MLCQTSLLSFKDSAQMGRSVYILDNPSLPLELGRVGGEWSLRLSIRGQSVLHSGICVCVFNEHSFDYSELSGGGSSEAET